MTRSLLTKMQLRSRMLRHVFSPQNELSLFSEISKLRQQALLRFNDGASHDGWFRTMAEGRCVDDNGEPLPWYTYAAIRFLKDRIQPNLKVLEFGAGQSTLWWANKASHVTSIEGNPEWYRLIEKKMPENVNLIQGRLQRDTEIFSQLCKEDYFEDKFDIIVVDDGDRVGLVEQVVLNKCAPEGVIIFDNSDRQENVPAIHFLMARGFKKLEFKSMIPQASGLSETTVFYRNPNCLGI